MKKTGFHQIGKLFRIALLIFLCTNVFSAIAQSARITLKMERASLEQVMNAIEKQSRYLFVNEDVKNIDQRVSIDISDKSIEETLNLLLSKTAINYRIAGKSIFISNKKETDDKRSGVPN